VSRVKLEVRSGRLLEAVKEQADWEARHCRESRREGRIATLPSPITRSPSSATSSKARRPVGGGVPFLVEASDGGRFTG